jgi:FK506-binding protein 4/5
LFVKKGHDGEEPFKFKTYDDQVIEGHDRALSNIEGRSGLGDYSSRAFI